MDVMADNLIYWHKTVQSLETKLEAMLQVIDPEDQDERRAFLSLLQTIMNARDKSQEVAVDLAPYCHPKLQAIAIQTTNNQKLIVEGGLPEMPE